MDTTAMRKPLILLVWLLAGVLLTASAAWSADESSGPVNPLAIRYETALWAIVVFVILLVILRKTAWGPILEGLQKREEHIKSAVEEAKVAREETRRVTAQFQAEMAAKMAEIPKIMEAARRDAEQLKEEMR